MIKKQPFDRLIAFDADMNEIPHKDNVGKTWKGVLGMGCFSANIHLEGGVLLCFQDPNDVPNELRPRERGGEVPVQVTVSINRFDQIVYDAVRTDTDRDIINSNGSTS